MTAIEYLPATLIVVDPRDPAIDPSRVDLALYAKTRDWNLIKDAFFPGSLPIKFHLRQLPLFMRTVTVDGSPYELFKYGVVRVENLPRPDGSAVIFDAMSPYQALGGKTFNTISDNAMEEYFSDGFLPGLVIEIGLVVKARSFLAPFSSPAYVVSRGLSEAITARTPKVP